MKPIKPKITEHNGNQIKLSPDNLESIKSVKLVLCGLSLIFVNALVFIFLKDIQISLMLLLPSLLLFTLVYFKVHRRIHAAQIKHGSLILTQKKHSIVTSVNSVNQINPRYLKTPLTEVCFKLDGKKNCVLILPDKDANIMQHLKVKKANHKPGSVTIHG